MGEYHIYEFVGGILDTANTREEVLSAPVKGVIKYLPGWFYLSYTVLAVVAPVTASMCLGTDAETAGQRG